MGKQGPCCHCGVTSTPLWRNGPPNKPVLCNACGSRWRTKGTLANYTPLHARGGNDDHEDHRASRVKNISMCKNKEVKVVKRNVTHKNVLIGGIASDYNESQKNVVDKDVSNRSSSGSATSNSESCVQFGGVDASGLTGPAQSFGGTQSVPSKKRTSVNRPKQSPFEKLTKDLYTIWHEQQSSCFSVTSEVDLLFDDEKPMVSVEIGHGSVLISHPSSIRDDESEASSLSVENRQSLVNEAYSNSLFSHAHSENKTSVVSCFVIEKDSLPIGQDKQQGFSKRDKFFHDKVRRPRIHDSLCDIDLNDILNFEVFSHILTNEEQQELLNYASLLDTTKTQDSIKEMFDSPEFKENISIYKRLLAEGVFDHLVSRANTKDSKTLQKQTTSNLSKSQWMRRDNQVNKCRNDSGKSLVRGESNVTNSNNSVGLKRSRDNSSHKVPELKPMKILKGVITTTTSEMIELMDSNGSYFSPRSLSASSPIGSNSLILNSAHLLNETSDQDLLLDLPPNGSFPEAELLGPAKSVGQSSGTGTGTGTGTGSSSLNPRPMRL